jgi:HAD domain in Swiss Army Knife RNA repair proteins
LKILFLDHYGVMCLGATEIVRTEHSMPTADEFAGTDKTYFSDFDPSAVESLNHILDQTGAEIVVSSDWKCKISIEGMCEFYQAQGIKKMPIDYTAWLPGAATYHEQRAGEINAWLEQHPETTHWAAVDDLYMGTWLTNFAWAKNVHLGINDPVVQQQILDILI